MMASYDDFVLSNGEYSDSVKTVPAPPGAHVLLFIL